jgi:predicted RND superfamily exporter protein
MTRIERATKWVRGNRAQKVLAFFIFSRWLSYITDKPVPALPVTVLLTILIGAKIPWLIFSTSVKNLIVEDVPERHRYEDFKTLFGTDEVIHVVLKGNDDFTPTYFDREQELPYLCSLLYTKRPEKI